MKQVNKINTELIDTYFSELEKCRARLKEVKESYETQNDAIREFRYAMRGSVASPENIQKYDGMINELAAIEVVMNKRQTQLDAVCSELEKAVRLKTLEAIAINRHILENTPIHYKKFKETVNTAIDNKWRFVSYIDSFGYPTMYISMERVKFSDSHIYMHFNDKKIDWGDKTQYSCLLDINEIYEEVSAFYIYQDGLNQAFRNLRKMYEDMSESLNNNYLRHNISDFYHRKARL